MKQIQTDALDAGVVESREQQKDEHFAKLGDNVPWRKLEWDEWSRFAESSFLEAGLDEKLETKTVFIETIH